MQKKEKRMKIKNATTLKKTGYGLSEYQGIVVYSTRKATHIHFEEKNHHTLSSQMYQILCDDIITDIPMPYVCKKKKKKKNKKNKTNATTLKKNRLWAF